MFEELSIIVEALHDRVRERDRKGQQQNKDELCGLLRKGEFGHELGLRYSGCDINSIIQRNRSGDRRPTTKSG